MQEDYKIPFGINFADLFKGFKQIDEQLLQTEKISEETGKAMKGDFEKVSKAADELKLKLKGDAEAAQLLRQTARDLGKDLSAAFSVKGKGREIEELVSKFQTELVKVGKNSKFNLDVVFNKATIQELANSVGKSSEEFKVLNQVVQNAKTQLATLDPKTEEFVNLNQQIQLASGLLDGFGEAEKIAETGSKSLKTQLRQLKADLAAMELAGQGGTEKFVQMSIKAGELEDQIGDVSSRVRVLASDTKYLDAGVEAVTALAGGFAVAQGAAALFGDENEQVNEALKKVTAAMAILQGIQAVANALNKDSTLNVLLFSRAQAAQVVTTEAVTAATVGEAVATESATVATQGFTAALLANPFTAIAVLLAAVVVGLIALASNSGEAEAAAKSLNDELDRQNRLLNVDEAGLKRRNDLLVAQAKAQGKTEAEISKIQEQNNEKLLDLSRKYEEEQRQLYNKSLQDKNLASEEFKKISDSYAAAQEKTLELETQNEVKRLENQASNNKKGAEDSKKYTDQLNKDAEQRKKISDQVLNFTKVLQAAQLSTMKEGFDKQRKQAEIQAEQQIADLNKEKALSIEAEKTRSEAISEIKKVLANELNEIDKDEIKTRFDLELSAAQQLIGFRKDSLEKELNQINVDKAAKEEAIKTEFKDEQELRESLLQALDEQTSRLRKEAALNFKIQRIENEQELEVLSAELLAGYADKPIAIEEAKQQEILRIQIKYQKEKLEALRLAGGEENALAIKQAEAVVGQLEAALKKSGEQKNFDLFTILGLDKKFTTEQKAEIESGIKAAFQGLKSSYKEITDYFIEQSQREIDARTEKIDVIDNEIQDLKDKLEKEKSYKEEGLAYSTANIEADIALKEEQKNEEIRIRNEALEEQRNIQKIQLALDTAAQASNMVTAITNIIKGLTKVDPTGISAAIAVTAMIGAFVLSKVKALQAINETPKFEFGGKVGGKRHSQGGTLIEAEVDEYVINRKSAIKYEPILKALNEDNFTDESLRRLLENTGVNLSSDDAERGVFESKQYDAAMGVVPFDLKSEYLGSIDGNISLLVSSEKRKIQTWEDDQFYYSKKGNKTTKKKK